MKAACLCLLLAVSQMAAADQGWGHSSVRGPVRRHSIGGHKPHSSVVGGGQRYLKSQGHAFGGGLSRLDTPYHSSRETHEHITVPEGFVYVYDLPTKFNTDLVDLPTVWHPEQYDIDQVLHKHLLGSPVSTRDPAQASIFFIPVYLGRLFNFQWQQFSDPSNAWLINRDCHGLSAWDCWAEKWEHAVNATSNLVKAAIAHVREQHPYWNATNGADHFMVFSYDHGKCEMARALRFEDFGELFSVQAYGSLVYRNDDKVQAVQRGESYNWRGPTTWACYRPDADILVPVYSHYGLDTLASPLAGARNISLLMRFDYPVGDGKSLVAHHGHRLRKELIDEWAARPLPGSELGLRSTAETEEDMRRSVFCVCPPGNTQDSARVWRAIILGCIPVTFFRAFDLPFQRHMGVPYSDFVLNIQPDDYRQLNSRVQRLLDNPAQLRAMQEALERHQRLFVWDTTGAGGIYSMVEKELALRAQSRAEVQSVMRR